MLGNHYLLASSPTPAVYFLFYKLREIQKEEEEEEVDFREASMGPLPFFVFAHTAKETAASVGSCQFLPQLQVLYS